MELAKDGKTEFKWDIKTVRYGFDKQEVINELVHKLRYYKGIRILKYFGDIILIW